MKVCIPTTVRDARDDRLYYKEARSLAKRHEVTLLAPVHGVGQRPWRDGSVRLVRLGGRLNAKSRVVAQLEILTKLRKERFDVVHIVDMELMAWAPVIRRITHARLVLDIWEANYELLLGASETPSVVRRAVAKSWRGVERWVAENCDLVLTADEAIADGLGSGVRPVVIYNYPLLSILRESAGIEKRPEVMESGKRYVIYHGSMSEERGIVSCVEMVRRVREWHPEVALLLLGNISERLKLQIDGCDSRGSFKEHVIHVNWVDHKDVGAYIAASEIGIVPFKRTRKFEKNIPQKIFEYWSFGLPVVSVDLKPVRAFFAACRGGVLTESNDPEVMARAVCALLDDTDAAREMGLRGKAMVEDRWRWEEMEKVLLDAYEQLR